MWRMSSYPLGRNMPRIERLGSAITSLSPAPPQQGGNPRGTAVCAKIDAIGECVRLLPPLPCLCISGYCASAPLTCLRLGEAAPVSRSRPDPGAPEAKHNECV